MRWRTLRCFRLWRWHFVNWHSISLGVHIDVRGPFLEVHLPFGFIRSGWVYWRYNPETGGGYGQSNFPKHLRPHPEPA